MQPQECNCVKNLCTSGPEKWSLSWWFLFEAVPGKWPFEAVGLVMNAEVRECMRYATTQSFPLTLQFTDGSNVTHRIGTIGTVLPYLQRDQTTIIDSCFQTQSQSKTCK
eukprot:3897478-Amphidinium_carterae.1